MPKIQLDPIQKLLHNATRTLTLKAQDEIGQLSSQIKQLVDARDAIAKDAGAGEAEMLAQIGKAHGVEIPTDARILDEDGDRYFAWGETAKDPSATVKRKANAKANRAEKAAVKEALKKA